MVLVHIFRYHLGVAGGAENPDYHDYEGGWEV